MHAEYSLAQSFLAPKLDSDLLVWARGLMETDTLPFVHLSLRVLTSACEQEGRREHV